jgi:hypothetical protein
LGSYYVIIYTYVTLSMLWLFDPISVKNMIWVMGIELVDAMLVVQCFCPVRC